MSIYFIPIVTLLGAALFRYRSIRALCRPISLSLNTGSLSPYFALRAQYGLLATAIARWAIRLRGRPISPYGLNTGSCRPGLRYAYPGLYSGAPSGRSISPFPNLTSAAGRCQFPRPKPHICRRQMSIPPLQTSHLPQADVHSPSQFMERGSGGEVTG